MAGLSGSIRSGNISSLLRSAFTTSNAIADYQDKLATIRFENSAKTYNDYVTYSKYLSGRSKSLQAAGGLSNISKATTLAQSATVAYRSYVSKEISRQTSNVLEGNASLYDKMNVLGQYYNMAADPKNGDPNLAQSLRGQMDSLSVQIQNQQITAANAAKDFAKMTANAQAGGYTDAINHIQGLLQQVSNIYRQGGASVLTGAIGKSLTKQIRAVYKAAGVPASSTPDIGSLYEGGLNVIAKYYFLKSQILAPTDPSSSADAMGMAEKYLSGQATVSSPFGDININSAHDIAANPGLEVQRQSIGKGGMPEYHMQQGDVTGWTIDPKSGKPIPIAGGATAPVFSTMDKNAKNDLIKKLQSAGFNVKESNGNLNLTLTDKTNSWLNPDKFGMTKNETITAIPTAQGIQLLHNDSNGLPHLYSIAFDNTNKAAVYQVTPKGPIHVTGQYGFNQQRNTVQNSVHAVVQNIMQKAPTMLQRTGGGFNFTDREGNPISALTYSKLTGTAFRSLLSRMAAKGDAFAGQALKYAGNDAAYNPAAIPLSVAHNWSSLVWGQAVNLQIPQAARIAGGSTYNYYANMARSAGQRIAAPTGMAITHF